MNLNQEAEALVRELGLELAVGYDKIRSVLSRIDDESDQAGERYGYERGLRAALRAVRMLPVTSLDPPTLGRACTAIESLLEETKGDNDE